MKKLLLLSFFLMNAALASDKEFNDYFSRFYQVFSSSSVDEESYRELVGYHAEFVNFVNYDNDSLDMFERKINASGSIVGEDKIIFNGNVSKAYFLRYLKEVVLSNDHISAGHPVDYKENNLLFTLKIEEQNENKVVIYENILFDVGDGNYSEHTCFYNFSRLNPGKIKLVDIICAG